MTKKTITTIDFGRYAPTLKDLCGDDVPSVRMLMLRTQLYTAMQQVKGIEADKFWELIKEIHEQRPERSG
jgi:hypothetical protein